MLLLQVFFSGLLLYLLIPGRWYRLYAFFFVLVIFFWCLYLWFALAVLPPKTGFSSLVLFECTSFFSFYPVCFGLDSLNIFFIVLTSFIFLVCLLGAYQSVRRSVRSYVFLLLVLEFLLLGSFLVFDFFLFYIFFEALLVPMFLLVGFWGSNVRRMKAAYYLFLYTLFGSLFLLVSLLLLVFQVGSFSWYFLFYNDLSLIRELLLWPGIFIAFAVKVPMFPFHIWLPEAHVEAPTGGSIVLASLLLKLGVFGFLRFLLPLFPFGTAYYSSLVLVFAVLGVFYSSFVALRQVDLKRIIAYSSVAHMNFGIVGLFSLTFDGLVGSYYLMLGHGVISGALFYLIGVLYDRYKTRIGFYYGGLALRMPLFCSFLFFFSAANIAFPGTFNYISELLIFLGVGISNLGSLVLILLSLFGTTLFTFWLYNRVAFGTLRAGLTPLVFIDLSRLEFLILSFFSVVTLVGGLFPGGVLSMFDTGFFYYFS